MYLLYCFIMYFLMLSIIGVSVDNQLSNIKTKNQKKVDSLQTEINRLNKIEEEYNRINNTVYQLKYARVDGSHNFTYIYYQNSLIKTCEKMDTSLVRLIVDVSRTDTIPTYFLLAFADMEARINHYNPDSSVIRSYANAWGLMQITEIAVKEINKKSNKQYSFKQIKNDPEENLKFAIDYIKYYGILSFFEELSIQYKDTKYAYYKIYKMVHNVYNHGPYSNMAYKSGYNHNEYKVN